MAVVTVGQRVQYPPGTLALRWDESPKTGIVLRGTLRAFIALPDGGQVTLQRVCNEAPNAAVTQKLNAQTCTPPTSEQKAVISSWSCSLKLPMM